VQLRHLRYFVKIVEARSFSRAAATIHVAQPALSQQIAELETEVGIALLHRSARGVRPTAAGETLYREAISILRQMEQLPGIVRSSGGEPTGPVSLGMSSTLAAFFSARFIERCKSMLPKVALRFFTGDSLLLKSRVLANTLDLALVFGSEQQSDFAHLPLYRQRLYLVRRDKLSNGASSISIGDLAGVPLLLPTHPNGMRSTMEQAFAAAGVVPNVMAEANVLSALLSAVVAGVGDTIVPKGDFSDIPGYGALIPIAIEPPVHLIASIVTSNNAPPARAGEAVRDLLAEFVMAELRLSPPPGAEWIGETAAISKTDGRIAT
jgi:LysR family transcriptional regulator, nitrogen assimilation regulatory protein